MKNDFFEKFISFKSFIVFLILFFIMFFLVLPQMTYPKIIPDKLFHYSANQLYSILSNYSIVDRQNYINASLHFDIIYPVIYSLTLFIPLYLLIKKVDLKAPLKFMFCFPFIAFFSDISENILIIYNIKHIDNFNFTFAKITGYFTTIKWSFIYLSFFMIIILLAFLIGKRKANKMTE